MRILTIILICCAITACDQSVVDTQSVTFSKAHWPIQQPVQFDIAPIDTTNTYNMFINLRNNHDYAYSNLYLITRFKHPHGMVITDTLEYHMATPQGEFLGTGYSDVYQNKLWYRDDLRFRESGTYQLTLQHAMRKNGTTHPIEQLAGVLDVGYSIEKKQHNGNE